MAQFVHGLAHFTLPRIDKRRDGLQEVDGQVFEQAQPVEPLAQARHDLRQRVVACRCASMLRFR